MAHLRRDFLIHGERDGQAIFDAMGVQKKELPWIEESDQRFYAYNYFGQHPDRLVGWFEQHMDRRSTNQRSLQRKSGRS